MSVNDQYALNWSNHTSHIRKAFDTLLSENQFVDVTLSCEGKKVVAHKIILSACSTYFHDLFRDNPCQHPIVILKDVKFQNLIDILKFIYNGEVSVSSDNFDSFLKTAELLQISGLTDDDSKQLEEASTTIESNETSSLETTSINLKSSPQPSQSTSTAATSTLTHRVKSPVTKKRPIEITQNEEPAVQRKKRESGLDIEIKEEISESNFEEDELNSIIDIKDPLQLEQQHEESDLSETLPVAQQSYPEVKDLLINEDIENAVDITCPPHLSERLLNELVPTMDQSFSTDHTSRQLSDEVEAEASGGTVDFSYLCNIKSDVMNLLNSCNEGKSILSSFKSNNGVLNHVFRRRLCHFIINSELSEDAGRRVPPERLYSLACQIKNVFPKEHVGTYYTPYSNYGPGLRKPPKGKLWDLLCNRKREYRKSGLITKQVRRAWQPEPMSPENPSSSN